MQEAIGVIIKTLTPNTGKENRFRRALRIFHEHGGLLRTSEVLREGIHPATLYALRDAGVIEMISRGVYRLGNLPHVSDPDLVTIASRVPSGVICLISALSFHGITTQIPHAVHIALKKGATQPRITYPPIATYRFSGAAFTAGIDIHTIDGVAVRVYNAEKTLADCCKFRNSIGLDVMIEALRLYIERGRLNMDALLDYTRICRVTSTMRPYLEALL